MSAGEAQTVAKERKSYAKRDALVTIERAVESQWEDERPFETDAPEIGTWTPEERNKYLITFPYPYMNGRLHLGHAFSLTKAEFASCYKRLKGVHTIWPFGFHCTGMPIQASADKLKREIAEYGNPPVGFPERVKVEKKKDEQAAKKGKSGKDGKSGKAKLAAKSGDSAAWSRPLFQWEIMRSLGVAEEDIAAFADPYHWLDYFPPYGMKDLKRFGASVDWRRSFITTDRNPFYDSFVRWQYTTLKKLGKIAYGKRPCVYSIRDNGPCADHDRQTGEGVGIQEFTLIKMRCMELPAPIAACDAVPEGSKVFLVAGTLRPETMYGQTNCWVAPAETYGVYPSAVDGEFIVCGEWAALNMSYQQILSESNTDTTPTPVTTLTGQDIIGTPLDAPLAAQKPIYALPFMGIKADRATGIVTSVPSDAPDDFAGLQDLKKKQPLREKFGVKDEWVLPFEPVPIIDTPGFGNLAAVTACEQHKIASQNDKAGLEAAKKEVYMKGFYEGVMLVGDHKGTTVQDAKPIIKAKLIADGLAAVYSEPEKPVISRSGDRCIVAKADQWYLTYGEEKWRAITEEALEGVDTFAPETKNAFRRTLEWLNKWACSRSYGLGTNLPFDEKWLVESLSDSTIYMAYYTVAHLLQGHEGGLDGSKPGPLGIEASQMTIEVWDHLLLGAELPSDCSISVDALAKMKNEFDYWYGGGGVNLRVSGKDLVPNHLTFFLYAHTAIFPKESWPTGIRANGHVLLNNDKMSKSTGNFMTLYDACETYSADAMRAALANAGDTLDDANFEDEVANSAILRLNALVELATELTTKLAGKGPEDPVEGYRRGPATTFADRVFVNAIDTAVKVCDAAYDRMLFREALHESMFKFSNARDQYRALAESTSEGANIDLYARWTEAAVIMLAPICPHICDHIWRDILKKGDDKLGKSSIFKEATFPLPTSEPDHLLARKADYVDRTARAFRLRRATYMEPKKGKKPTPGRPAPKKISIGVALEFPAWQQIVLKHLNANWDDAAKDVSTKEVAAALKADSEFPAAMFKNAMKFAAHIKEDAVARGRDAFEVKSPFDEKEVLEAVKGYLKLSLAVEEVVIANAGELGDANAENAAPGNPCCAFEGDEA